jgi:hypothetical protein
MPERYNFNKKEQEVAYFCNAFQHQYYGAATEIKVFFFYGLIKSN